MVFVSIGRRHSGQMSPIESRTSAIRGDHLIRRDAEGWILAGDDDGALPAYGLARSCIQPRSSHTTR
jgi:hypothetical protein